jgi:hypothetical protein
MTKSKLIISDLMIALTATSETAASRPRAEAVAINRRERSKSVTKIVGWALPTNMQHT